MMGPAMCLFFDLRMFFTLSVIIYFLIKPETQAALADLPNATPAHRLLQAFIEKDELRVRFKVTPRFDILA
jgi:hypothetical protein